VQVAIHSVPQQRRRRGSKDDGNQREGPDLASR
jgi:hypothetical protein